MIYSYYINNRNTKGNEMGTLDEALKAAQDIHESSINNNGLEGFPLVGKFLKKGRHLPCMAIRPIGIALHR